MKYYFFPQSIYTHTVAFADLFNDMGIRVYDNKTNDIIGYKPVPVTLSPKEKIAHILNSSEVNDVDPQVDNYLPRISITPPDINWDSARMRGKHEKRLLNIEYNLDTKIRQMQMDVQSVPVTLNFTVTLWTKYYIDMTQLLENIMPWFAPEAYVSFKERNFGIEHKARVLLTGSSKNFVYEYGETDRRVLQWDLTFSMDGVLYKPMELNKEILCTIIKIAEVPCKKVPFPGEKIIAYEPITNSYESILTKNPKLSIHNLDASESYDLMIKYWKHSNTVMNPPDYQTCINESCKEDPGPRPEWDAEFNNTPCNPVKKKPCISIDSTTKNISAAWQEEIVGTDNKIRIIAWQEIYDNNGTIIQSQYSIPLSAYPTNCYPVYNEDISSIPPVIIPPITSISPSSIEPIIPSITGCVVPEYITTG